MMRKSVSLDKDANETVHYKSIREKNDKSKSGGSKQKKEIETKRKEDIGEEIMSSSQLDPSINQLEHTRSMKLPRE